MTTARMKNYLPDKARLIKNFNSAAGSYDDIAVLQKTVAERLLEHLDPVNILPRRILDLGAGTGGSARQLRKRFKQAGVVQLDMALKMLSYSRKQSARFFSGQAYVCADADRPPFKPAAFDLVFSSLMIQWSHDPDSLFTALKKCLMPGGLFLFSTLGPDTLLELKESWAEVDSTVHVNAFLDMHDIGDALIRAGFIDPVMEVETLTLTYTDVIDLMRELKQLGARNVNAGRHHGLTGKSRFQHMAAAYERRRVHGKLPASYEVIYGHAWVPDKPVSVNIDPHTAVVPVAAIKRNG